MVINNKLGSDPNSVSLNMKQVPVAILTTSAGEYVTLRDFDATTVDLSTGVGGTKANFLATQSGGTEVHGKLHIEASKELDETTMDEDLAAVLHFTLADSEVYTSTTETCVWDRRTDSVFFGERYPSGSLRQRRWSQPGQRYGHQEQVAPSRLLLRQSMSEEAKQPTS